MAGGAVDRRATGLISSATFRTGRLWIAYIQRLAPACNATVMTATEDLLHVVVLEDDQMLRERVLLPRLADYGFKPVGMETAAQLFAAIALRVPDIVVLDVGLPDSDGYEVTRRLRLLHPGLGIVLLTARGETPDRVRGLSQGADAYLSKPVEMDLLAATLHSLARRMRGQLPSAVPGWHLEANGWNLVTPAGDSIALTKAERRFLARLTATAGEAVSRDELMAALSSNVHDFDPHRLETLVYRLRRKVEQGSGAPLPLAAVHGEGYVLTAFA